MQHQLVLQVDCHLPGVTRWPQEDVDTKFHFWYYRHPFALEFRWNGINSRPTSDYFGSWQNVEVYKSKKGRVFPFHQSLEDRILKECKEAEKMMPNVRSWKGFFFNKSVILLEVSKNAGISNKESLKAHYLKYLFFYNNRYACPIKCIYFFQKSNLR